MFAQPVKKIETLLSKNSERILALAAKADALDGGDDPAAVVAAENAVANAKAEKAVLEKALAAAQAAAAKEAKAEAARQAEARRVRLVADGEANFAELVEALVVFARLAGRNASICDALPGPDAMRLWIGTAVEKASKQACKGVKPRTIMSATFTGQLVEVVTSTNTRQIDMQLTVPLADVE